MPVLLFSVAEVASALILRQRAVSLEIRELADLEKKPLNPGESVADRHHKLAKLAKKLADAFAEYDAVMTGATEAAAEVEHAEHGDAPAPPDSSQAN
jgi:hypothetical protein